MIFGLMAASVSWSIFRRLVTPALKLSKTMSAILYQSVEYFEAGRGFQVDGDAALVPVQREEVRPQPGP